jgi:hypothetical protein
MPIFRYAIGIKNVDVAVPTFHRPIHAYAHFLACPMRIKPVTMRTRTMVANSAMKV